MIPIHLDWTRCQDGVISVGESYRPASDRRTPISYDVADLENPVVLHFINAWEHDGQEAFLSRFGMPTTSDEVLKEDMEDRGSRYMVGLALSTNENEFSLPGGRTRHVNHFLKNVSLRPSFELSGVKQSPRLVMHAADLLGLMAMEIALASEVGAEITSCTHCKKFYLTGPLTGRRSHSQYCSDRCRVAAMRKRNARRP